MAGNKDSTCSGCWREHLPCWAVPGTRAETTGDELRGGTQESSWDNDSDSSRDSEEIAMHRCVKKGAALPPTIQSFLFSYAGALFFFFGFFFFLSFKRDETQKSQSADREPRKCHQGSHLLKVKHGWATPEQMGRAGDMLLSSEKPAYVEVSPMKTVQLKRQGYTARSDGQPDTAHNGENSEAT